MPQDAFTLRHVARELNSILVGGKINRINQPEREEISLLIYTGKRTVKLTLNVNASDCGVYFTETDKENPLTAPNFCMLLRKHLQNAEILSVEQIEFERILAIRLYCTSDFSACERVLYAEIMGKYSNLILVENGVILGSMKVTSLEDNHRRILMSGAKYQLPAPQDKVNPTDKRALSVLLTHPNTDDLPRFLFEKIAGIAPSTAEAIVSSFQGGDFVEHTQNFLFSDKVFPCVLEKKGQPVDFFAYAIDGALPFETLSEAQQYFYEKRTGKKRLEGMRRKLASAVKTANKKTEKRLAQILEKYRECEEMELNRIKGELLTANLYRLQKGMNGCELENYYSPDGATLKITLDSTLTPSQNAQRYFKKYQKQKRTLDALAPQEKETRAELDYYERLLSQITVAENEEDFRSLEEELTGAGIYKLPPVRTKKKKEEIPYRVFEKGGFRILIGRNNLQNDKLVKSSSPDDTWLHTQKYHSAHVVIESKGKNIPDEILEYGARLCVKYSDGKAGSKIPVDYCKVKFVKKPSGAKAGFVVYTDYQTILVDPLEE